MARHPQHDGNGRSPLPKRDVATRASPTPAQRAARIHGVIAIDDGELCIDLDHLADVLSAVKPYRDA